MSRGAVAVGVVMASFLVWLWRYSPEAEDEVAAWLEKQGLASIRHRGPIGDVQTLEQLADVDIDQESLTDVLLPSSLSSLRSAVSQLGLQLWLREGGLEELLPRLVESGHTSKHSLQALDPSVAAKLADTLSPPERGQRFLNLLTDLKSEKVEETSSPDTSFSVGSMLKFGFYLLLITLVLAIGVLAVVYFIAIFIGEIIATVVVQIVFILVSAIFRTRTTPPPTAVRLNIRPSVSGFLEFLARLSGGVASGIVQWVRTTAHDLFSRPQQMARRRHGPASEAPEFRLGLVERIRGQYLDHGKCTLEWNHDDNVEVGGASVATLHLVCRNSTPYELQTSDALKVTIKHSSSRTVVPHAVEPAPPTNHSKLRLSFSTRLAGGYSMDVTINGKKIADSPFSRNYLPGPVDPAKTTFIDQTNWLVVTAGAYYSMMVAPRDSFGNTANIVQDFLTVCIRKDGPEGLLVSSECVVERQIASRFELLLKVDDPGHYIGNVLYKEQRIGPPQFTIISLSTSDEAAVDKNLQKKSLNVYYEASMTADNGRQKKVYCYVYPKQLQVKEFYLKIIPYRLFTCKVCPSTNIRLHPEAGSFTLDDGYQTPVRLHSRHREIIAATFYKFVLKNIGGSEQFKDKQQFFFTELKKHHAKHTRSETRIHVNRFSLLESALQVTKGFSTADWCKSFVVEFRGEEALDWGGVSRELFQLLCARCFDCTNGMFRRFKDDPQALVHPNHKHPPNITLRHYQFAGHVVGKCLYESAQGNRLLVTARFTRSFLAQIIGLRINYKYFENDDPDLYTTKIHYIRDNDVSDLGLVFAEEEFSEGEATKVVPLIEHGEDIEVTEVNKMQYLNLLAQYRLAKQTREQMESFLKGLNDLIPDNLLGMFDENELELLMCGTETVSYEDLKKHSVVSASLNPAFQTVVSWFWVVVGNFTQEEMARLLQFVTGCSQLPPGGFKELSPKFQITSAPTHGRLPSAHTCFNQLCLPEYDTCEQFQSALMMAINEGAEGFGFL